MFTVFWISIIWSASTNGFRRMAIVFIDIPSYYGVLGAYLATNSACTRHRYGRSNALSFLPYSFVFVSLYYLKKVLCHVLL